MLTFEHDAYPALHYLAFEHEQQAKEIMDQETPVAVAAKKINWRNPCCGGSLAHGTVNCMRDAKGIWRCVCANKPKNFDYEIHHQIAVQVFSKKLHLEKSGEKWDAEILQMFTLGSFKKYQQIQGKTMKERFFNTMVEEVEKRHALGDSAGFEIHPEISPYDKVMLTMMKEIETADAKKKFEKEKKEKKNSTLLSHEKTYCPIINVTKRTSIVFNDDGDEIAEEIKTDKDVNTASIASTENNLSDVVKLKLQKSKH